MNEVPTPAHKTPLFRFNSPGFNRSKYLALFTLRELEKKGYPTDFIMLYVNSGVCYWTLLCSLPRWIKWNYLYSGIKDGEKQYRLTTKGRRFLDKLDKIIPSTVDQWLDERDEWRGILPDPIGDWRRSALIKLLEPMHYHRQGHPGIKKSKAETKRSVRVCKQCREALIDCQYEGHPAEYCPNCKCLNILLSKR